MFDNHLSAVELRQWASQCEAQLNDPRLTAAERAKVQKMKRALLHLAEQQDWLKGTTGGAPGQRNEAGSLADVIAVGMARRR